MLTASDGLDAMGVVRAHDGPLELVVTDVVMPGTSGPDLVAQVRAVRPDIRVLYMSGYTDDSVVRLENLIDKLDHEIPMLRHFILSDGAAAGASLHFARTVCRRAERAVLSLGKDAVEPVVLVYLNRLSDLLFTMARAANHRAGSTETPW